MSASRSIAPLAATVIATAIVAGGCGGSSGSDGSVTQSAAATTVPTTAAPATTTQGAAQTQTQAQAATTAQTPAQKAGQKERAVSSQQQNLKLGGVTTAIKVTKLADPVVAEVDAPQKGMKLIGVFINTQTAGASPGDLLGAELKTSSGKTYPVRIIADGDCGGGFLRTGMISATKPTDGCVGFEIRKGEHPAAITFTLFTPPAKTGAGQQSTSATWPLTG